MRRSKRVSREDLSAVAVKACPTISPAQGKNILDAMLEYVVNEACKGRATELRGFGVLTVKKRAARMGQNPRTKEPVPVPERYTLMFKPSDSVVQRITDAPRQHQLQLDLPPAPPQPETHSTLDRPGDVPLD